MANDYTVAAVITGLSTGIPATLAALAALKKAARAEKNTRPNGHGPLPAMAERQLKTLGRVEGKLDEVKDQLVRHVSDKDAHR